MQILHRDVLTLPLLFSFSMSLDGGLPTCSRIILVATKPLSQTFSLLWITQISYYNLFQDINISHLRNYSILRWFPNGFPMDSGSSWPSSSLFPRTLLVMNNRNYPVTIISSKISISRIWETIPSSTKISSICIQIPGDILPSIVQHSPEF